MTTNENKCFAMNKQNLLKKLNEHKDDGENSYGEGMVDALHMMGYEPIFDYNTETYIDIVVVY